MTGTLRLLGAPVLAFIEIVGRLTLFAGKGLAGIVSPPWFPRHWLRQLVDIGFFSLPVVGLTALFSGMVLALQSYSGFQRFNAEGAIATVVVLSLTRELGPVLGGLMVAGRVGASIAAELGTMKVTEQIDALRTLQTDPIRYLVTPRLVAGLIAMPLLVLVADIIGVFGGFLVAVGVLDFNASVYLQQTLTYLETSDVVLGLIKASVFGFIVALMGCLFGFEAQRGAAGVGRATTSAVVVASILILISNYMLTDLLFAR